MSTYKKKKQFYVKSLLTTMYKYQYLKMDHTIYLRYALFKHVLVHFLVDGQKKKMNCVRKIKKWQHQYFTKKYESKVI